MAKMIDQKPSYHGEAKVWDSLSTYLPNNIVVYNNREINGREFDYCLFIENIGVLIIEVKGWLKDKINVLGVDNIVVEGYDKPQRSPKKQARAYRFALLNKIADKYNVSVEPVSWPERDLRIESSHTYFNDSKIRKLLNITEYKQLADFAKDL